MTGGDITESVLYADVLFLVDFSMDTVTLWLTSKLIHYPIKTVRCAVSAGMGAFVSTILTAIEVSAGLALFLGFVTSLLMCLTAFGFSGVFGFAKSCAVLWTVGMVLGGVMTFLLSRGTYSRVYTGALQTESSVHLFPLSAAICSTFVWFLRRVNRKRRVRVSITFGDYTADTVGIVDSGNFLKDPITGDGVIVVSSDLLPEEFQKLDFYNTETLYEHKASLKIRLIPVSSVTGSKMLLAVRPDSVKLDGREVKCLVAISDENKNKTVCIVPEGIA